MALLLACANAHDQAVRLLLRYGASIHRLVVEVCARHNAEECLKVLPVEAVRVGATSEALRCACRAGSRGAGDASLRCSARAPSMNRESGVESTVAKYQYRGVKFKKYMVRSTTTSQ